MYHWQIVLTYCKIKLKLDNMKSAERFRHFIPHPDLCFVNELALKVLARYYILEKNTGPAYHKYRE